MFSNKITTSTRMQRDTAANFLRTDSSTQYPERKKGKNVNRQILVFPPKQLIVILFNICCGSAFNFFKFHTVQIIPQWREIPLG